MERSFKGLLVWQQAMDLAKGCYFLTKTFPREELYGLTSQLRRAAAPIPADIAEGSGRTPKRDFVNFLRIAQGSLRELETYLLSSIEVELATPERIRPLLQRVESIAKLLNRLIQSLASARPIT